MHVNQWMLWLDIKLLGHAGQCSVRSIRNSLRLINFLNHLNLISWFFFKPLQFWECSLLWRSNAVLAVLPDGTQMKWSKATKWPTFPSFLYFLPSIFKLRKDLTCLDFILQPGLIFSLLLWHNQQWILTIRTRYYFSSEHARWIG